MNTQMQRIAQQSTAFGLLMQGCQTDVLEKVAGVLGIMTPDMKGDRGKVFTAIIEDFAEGWE